MPIVSIQTPSGGTVQIDAPDGATDDQILRFAKSQGLFNNQQAQSGANLDVPTSENMASDYIKPEDDRGLIEKTGDVITGVGEAALSLGTGASGGAIGHISGAVEGIYNQITGDGTQQDTFDLATKKAQQSTYTPRSKYGQELMRDIAKTLGKLPAVMGTPAITTPLSGTVRMTKGAGENLNRVITKPARVIRDAKETRNKILEEIKSGNINAGNIAKTLDQNGELIKNPNMKKAIKMMGDDESAYSTVINFEKMDNTTKSYVNKMLDKIESNKKSGDPAQIMTNRPADVIGDALSQAVIKLNDDRKLANNMIKKSVEGLKGKRIKTIDEYNLLADSLNDKGIKTVINENGRVKIDTSRARATIGDVASKEKIENILNQLKSGDMDGKSAHELKQFTREAVSFDPAGTGTSNTSKSIENALKKLSSNINDKLQSASSTYKKGNEKYAESIGPLKRADKLLGNNLMIGDKLASSKFGMLSKKIGSNLQSKDNILMLVDELKSNPTTKNSISDVPRMVAALADMEKIFKFEPEQSPFGFQSRVAQGAAEALNGSPVGLTKVGYDALVNKFKSMSELEFDAKMKALRKLAEER